MKKRALTLILTSLLVLLTACQPQAEPTPSPPTDTPAPSPEATETGVSIDDPNIVWCDGVDGDGEMWETRLPNGSAVTYQLQAALEAGEDDDLFAVVVCILGSRADSENYDQASYDTLRAASDQAQTHLSEVYHTVIDELVSSRGISKMEAGVRAFQDPELIAAREAASAAELEADRYQLEWYFETNGDALYALEALGFTLVCDARDSAYQNYLARFYAIPLGIAIGTKEQISTLPISHSYRYYLAAKDGADYEPWMPLTDYERSLTGDNKLTDELLAIYEENGGAACPVQAWIGYFGKEYDTKEAEAIALRELGFASKSDLYTYGTEEDEDAFIQRRFELTCHTAYNNELLGRLFREGEVLLTEHYYGFFYAQLTYDRALELVKNKEIAYIEPVPADTWATENLDWDLDG